MTKKKSDLTLTSGVVGNLGKGFHTGFGTGFSLHSQGDLHSETHPGVNVIKRFFYLNVWISRCENKSVCPDNPFQPSLIFDYNYIHII
jgi:hypothetical protein